MMPKKRCNIVALAGLTLLLLVNFSSDSEGISSRDIHYIQIDIARQNLAVAKTSVDHVELEYCGPASAVVGKPINATLSLSNKQDGEICLIAPNIRQLLDFMIVVQSPSGRSAVFRTNGVPCHVAGQQILYLRSGEHFYEHVDLSQFLIDGPGDYRLTILRDYNGVVHFPSHLLRVELHLLLGLT